MAPQDRHDGTAAVRRLPGKRFEQNTAQRVDVRERIDPPAGDELGRRIVGRAAELPR